jgi:putative ATP-dependent endonuclease of OLD family
VNDGFEIEALIGDLDLDILAKDGKSLSFFGLAADGTLHDLPEAGREQVLRVRVTGTPDFEVLHELLVPNGETAAFTLSLRRRIGMLRISDDSSSVRALRIGPSSLLGRQFNMADLRGSVRVALDDVERALELTEPTIKVVDELEDAFQTDGFPDNIDLGLVSPQGTDLVSMVELVRGDDPNTAIPIGLSGSGTRALVTFSILARAAPEQAIVLLEEPERGLEPFSQRIAAGNIVRLSRRGQGFITTHSPTMLEELAETCTWRVEKGRAPIALTGEPIKALFKMDAEAIFSPIAIVCEGPTERGFLSVMLPQLLGKSLHNSGIHLIEGEGQPQCLTLAETLADTGMDIGLFIDNETKHTGFRDRVRQKTRCFVWQRVINIEHAVATHLPFDQLPRLMSVPQKDERYTLDEVRRELGENGPDPTWEAIVAFAPESDVRNAVARAANKGKWFKTFDNGAALATLLLELGVPQPIQEQLEAFARLYER